MPQACPAESPPYPVAFDFLRILTSTVSCLWETVPYAEGTGASSDPRGSQGSEARGAH